MTENEIELIELIRKNDNPERALMTAVLIALGLLKQIEESSDKAADGLRVFS